MASLKTLASDTVVYGASTILSRLLNWLMMPFYVRVISQAEYGMVTVVYSIVSLLLVVATLGFETGYFRFANDDNKNRLLGSLSGAVLGISALMAVVLSAAPDFFAKCFGFGPHGAEFILPMIAIVGVDAYNAIFFAELRYERRSVLYAGLRLLQVVITIIFNCIFLLWLSKSSFSMGISPVAYVLFANLLGSLSSTLFFLPRIFRVIGSWDVKLFGEVLMFSLPLVGMGFLGMCNQNIEKLLIIDLDSTGAPLEQVGIYAASYKIGILMAIFTQSFRMAFEPFFFRENRDGDKRDVSGPVLKYFVYFGLLIFAGVMLFKPLICIFRVIPANYVEGLRILPFILMGQLFFGVYYSISMWYKAIDKTYWGIIMSASGLAVNVTLNCLLIPRMGYLGAAISTFFGYLTMMMLSFLLGQKYYPINYPFAEILTMTVKVLPVVLIGSYLIDLSDNWLWILVALPAFALVVWLICKNETALIAKLRRRK